MTELTCNTLVIGAGPAGYVCAIRAGQLGIDTIIVEAGKPGGTCLNVGCIPSKALIHAAEVFHQATLNHESSALGIKAGKPRIQFGKTVAWKDGIVTRLTGGVSNLLKKNRVRRLEGRARFVDGKTVDVETDTGSVRVSARNIVIATGSDVLELPGLPLGGKVISSSEALNLSAIPGRLAVIGAGYIGLELGTAFAKLGSDVTIVEAGSRILPQYDAELTAPVGRRLAALGVDVRTDTIAIGMCDDHETLLVKSKVGATGEIAVDQVLVAVGRRPLIEGWGRESLLLDMAGSSIRIDDQCRTSMAGIYAIGDVTGEPMLAHRAMAQGEMVAELISGQPRRWDKRWIPAICFTDPELVSVGLCPEKAIAEGIEVSVTVFPFAANGRAMTMEREDGFVRIIARKDNNLVLGLQAVGQGVPEMAAAFSLAIEMGARLEDIAHTIHAHPSLGEAIQECALRSLGHALHI